MRMGFKCEFTGLRNKADIAIAAEVFQKMSDLSENCSLFKQDGDIHCVSELDVLPKDITPDVWDQIINGTDRS